MHRTSENSAHQIHVLKETCDLITGTIVALDPCLCSCMCYLFIVLVKEGGTSLARAADNHDSCMRLYISLCGVTRFQPI
jgi:hypothetical protein